MKNKMISNHINLPLFIYRDLITEVKKVERLKHANFGTVNDPGKFLAHFLKFLDEIKVTLSTTSILYNKDLKNRRRKLISGKSYSFELWVKFICK